MVTATKRSRTPAWHATFLAMLPAIRRHAKIAFRHLDPEAREEAVQEVVCNACCAVARLAKLGKLDLAYPTVLARYAVAQVNDGRKVGCKLNVRDVSSAYCQRRKDVTVERLDRFDSDEAAGARFLSRIARPVRPRPPPPGSTSATGWIRCRPETARSPRRWASESGRERSPGGSG